MDITNNKTLTYKICCSQEGKLRSMLNFSMSFIYGRSNYALFVLKDHDNSACHQRVILEKEHEEVVAIGKSLPPRKIQHYPLTSESPRYLGIQQMSEKDTKLYQNSTLFPLISVAKTFLYSLSKPSCIRETSWCNVYLCQ